MATNFYPVAININITPAVKHTALRRAADKYEAVYYGNVSTDEAAKAFLDRIKEEVRGRKENGYDPNPVDNDLLFSRFVPKDAAKRFNALGITIVGNGKRVAVERWYRDCDGFKTVKSGYWLLVDPDGNFEARGIDHSWFPRSIIDLKGGFLGYDLDYDFFLSKEDGKIYTTNPAYTKLNPGGDKAKELMEKIQFLYRPEFATGSSLFGGTPTKNYYGRETKAFNPLMVSAGGVDLLITHYDGGWIEFGIENGGISFFHTNQRGESESKRIFRELTEYLCKDKDLDALYTVLKRNREETLVFGLKALVEFLKTGNPGLGDITRGGLKEMVKGYPVFFEVFKEFVVTPPQVRKDFLEKTSPKGINVVDKINHEIFFERGIKSEKVILLSDLIGKDTILHRGQDIYPYSNFGFEYKGDIVTLDKVWIPEEGITLAQLESGDFYFGDTLINERIDFRYAKDPDSTRLDDIVQWVDQNKADHDFYRKK